MCVGAWQEIPGGQAVLVLREERARDLLYRPGEHVRVKQVHEDGTVLIGFADGRESWVHAEEVSMVNTQAGRVLDSASVENLAV